MKLLMEVLSATTRLDLAAAHLDDPEKLKAQMLQVSAELKAAAEQSSSTWGVLAHAVKALEKGERIEL